MSLALRGLDRWLTTDPASLEPDIPLPGEEGYPRCSACGAFLRRDPDPGRTEYGSEQEHCDGKPWQPGGETPCGRLTAHEDEPHQFTVAAWEVARRRCRNRRPAVASRFLTRPAWECGHDNTEVLA